VLLPVLAAIPLFGLFIWVAVGRGLNPLRAMASAVQTRSPDLLEPIVEERTPTEIKPLVGAINRLLQRLANALSVQRRFVADAAHELRTPLTALQLQAQLAGGARIEAERITAFAALHESLKRETHLVEQLLALARQEPDSTTRPAEQVDLDALARLLIEEKLPLAEAKRIDLGMVRSERAAVRGDANALRIMLRNLIDNAIRYTLEGGRVDVAVAREAACVILEVSDTGPGIPSEERERVFDRFYRSPGNDVPTGSGLGLAIVKTVVEKHDGTVVLTEPSDHSGLLVRVSLSAE
jgi:two-component system OmpR family sensor kinase